MSFLKLIVLVALVSAVVAGPAGYRTTCVSECSATNAFKYEQGRTYEYSYEAKTEMNIGNGESNPGLLVTADVRIQPASPCEFVLTLSNVVVDGTSRSEEFAEMVSQYPIRFGFQSGVIERVCSSVEEPIWVTNFKKGIISSFQSSMENELTPQQVVTETDISGTCTTTYQATTENNIMTVVKEKSSTSCEQAPDHAHLSTFGFNFDSIVDGASPIKSFKKCTQEISEGTIKSSYCEDTYNYIPFTENTNLMVEATASTTLNLLQVSGGKAIPSVHNLRQSSLIYEESEHDQEVKYEKLHKILSELNKSSKNDIVTKDTPILFSQLIATLKQASFGQIQTLIETFNEERPQKFLIDALPLVGTPSSTLAVARMIKKDILTDNEKDIWYSSLSFIKDTSKDVFQPLNEIIHTDTSSKALFGVSSLINTYCKSHSECENVPEVRDILQYIESLLGVSCRVTTEDEKTQILVVLKALGNAGRFINAESILRRCFTEDNSMEIRVAAIDAWRKTPCSYNRNALLSTYEDYKQPDEIRIASYMAVMKCPSKEIIDTIKDRLMSESVNQVASFVWSHLSNVQESADHNKQYIREMIGEEILQKKFQPDALRFSRYFESSIFSDVAHLGEVAEGSVVFSSDSYLPRSANLNMTFNVFGKTVNLFEVGARIESYEQFIEKFFGPNGYFPDEAIESFIKNLKDQKLEQSEEYQNNLISAPKEPTGSFFVRMFGNDLIYKNHFGTEDILEQLGIKNPLDIVMELARNKKIEFMKSYNFLNTEFTIPTITGFPLSMALDGSATVAFDIGGQYEVNALDSFTFNGKIKPSAAIKLQSVMVVDAFVTKSGIKYTTTVQSGSQIEGKAVMKGYKLIDFSFKAPEEDMMIYDYYHEFITIQNDQENRMSHPEQGVENCYPSEILGLKLCMDSFVTEMEAPKIHNRPARSIILKKTDSHTSYDFNFKLNKKKLSILLDRPGSTIDAKKSLTIDYNGKDYSIDVYSRQFSGRLQGQFDVKNTNKMVTGELMVGDEMIYSGELKLNQDYSNGWNVSPIMTLKDERRSTTSEVSATVGYDLKKQTFIAQAKQNGVFSLPAATIEFAWKIGKRQRDFSLSVDLKPVNLPSENLFSIDLSGNAKLKKRVIAMDINGKYKLRDASQKKFDVGFSFKKDQDTSQSSFNFIVKLPPFGIDATSKADISPDKFLGSLDLTYKGRQTNLDVTYKQKKSDQLDRRVVDVAFKSGNVDAVSHMEVEIDEKAISQLFTFKYDTYNVKQNVKVQRGKSVVMETTVNGKNLISANFERSKNGKISGEMTVGDAIIRKTITASGFFHNRSVPGKVDAELEMIISGRKIRSSLLAEEKHLSFEAVTSLVVKSKAQKQPLRVIADITPSTFHFDTNVGRRVVVDAKANMDTDVTKVDFSAEYEDYNPITITAEFSANTIEGKYNNGKGTVTIHGHVTQDTLESSVQWSPSEKLAIVANYDFGSNPSVRFTVNTPFSGWEKQEARFNYSLQEQRLKGQLSLVWKNTHHLTATFDANLKNTVNVELSFVSTIKNFERITAALIYNGFSLSDWHTELLAEYRNKKVHGKIITSNKDQDYNLSSFLKTPYTQDLEVEMNLKERDARVNIELIGAYGPKNIHVNIDYKTAYQLDTLKVQMTSNRLPNINFDVKMAYDIKPNVAVGFTLDISGDVADREFAVTLSGKDAGLKDRFAYNVELTAVQPLTVKPFVASMYMETEVNQPYYEIQYSMSHDFVYPHEPLSFNAKTNMLFGSLNNLYFTSNFDSKIFSGSVNLKHKFDGESFESELGYKINNRNLLIKTNGQFNADNLEGTMTTKLQSSHPRLDGTVLNLRHQVSENSRQINGVLKYQKKKYTISNNFKRKNQYNYENVFKVNDIFLLKTKLKNVPNKPNKYEFEAQTPNYAIEGYYTSKSGSKELYISTVRSGEKYFNAHIIQDGTFRSGKLNVEALIPYLIGKEISSQLSYELTSLPASVKGFIKIGDSNYDVLAEITKNRIKASLNQDYVLNMSYQYDENNANFDYKLKTPAKQSAFSIKIQNAETKSVIVNLDCGDAKYNLNTKYNDGHYQLNLQGPNTNTEVDLQLSQKSLMGTIVKDGSKIKVNLEGDFQPKSGHVEFSLKSKQLKTINTEFQVKYNLESASRQFSLNGKVGRQEFKFENYINMPENMQSVEFGIEILTPFEVLKEASISGTISLVPYKQNVELVAKYNLDKTFSLKGKVDGNFKTLEIVTPDMELEAKTDSRKMKLEGSFKRNVLAKTRPITYDFKFDLRNREFFVLGYDLKAKGSIEVEKQEIRIIGLYQRGSADFELNVLLVTERNSPQFDITFKRSQEISKLSVKTSIEPKKFFSAVFDRNGEIHKVELSTTLPEKKGDAQLEVKLPSMKISPLVVKFNYDFESQNKNADLHIEHDNKVQEFSVNTMMSEDKFSVNMRTPFNGYTKVEIQGSREYTGDLVTASGSVKTDLHDLEFTADLTPSVRGYDIKGRIPTKNGNMIVKGDISKQSVSLFFTEEGSSVPSHSFSANYGAGYRDFSLEIQTSLPELSEFSVQTSYSVARYEGHFDFAFKVNDYTFDIDSEYNWSDRVPQFSLEVRPNNGQVQKIAMKYDIYSSEKEFEFEVQFNDKEYFVKAHSMQASDDLLQGIVKVTSSFEKMKMLSVEYDFEKQPSTIMGFTTLTYNNKSFQFKVKAVTSDRGPSLEFITPFEGYEHISFINELDIEQRHGLLKMQIGDMEFSLEGAFTPERIYLNFVTPLEDVKLVRFVLNKVWSQSEKAMQFGIGYNDEIFEIGGRVVTKADNAGFMIKLVTPYTNDVEINMIYNLQNTEDLFDFKIRMDSMNYYAKFGMSMENERFMMKSKINLPTELLTEVVFVAGIDFSSISNGLKLYFENNGTVYVNVEGRVTENDTSFDLVTPTQMFGNVRTVGRHSRSRRSTEFRMMSDQGTGILSANFHSFKFSITSPFAKLKMFEISVSKSAKGKVSIDYKRNDYYLHYESNPTKKGIDFKIDGSIPGWELLALTGRMDHESIAKHLIATIPEAPMTISGKGTIGKRGGSAKIVAKTGLEKLGIMTTEMAYKRRRSFSLKSISDVNPAYKINIDFKDGGLILDISIPHAQQPTIIKGQLTLFAGELNISSRFEAIRTYSLSYKAVLKKDIEINSKITRNGIDRLVVELRRSSDGTGHFLFEIRLFGNHSKFHYHRSGLKELEAMFERNGETISIKLKTEGNLPEKGDIIYDIQNTLRLVDKEISGRVHIDRTASPKKINIDVNVQPSGRQYTIYLQYNADLSDLSKGDFSLNINAPVKVISPIEPIKGEWSLNKNKNGKISLSYGKLQYKLKGKFSIRDSEFTIESNRPGFGAKRTLGWRFIRNRTQRDYYFKYGTDKRYTHLELAGTVQNLRNADVKGKIHLRRMTNTLSYAATWSGNDADGISGTGSFSIGKQKGSFKLHKLQRDPAKRATNFKLTGTSTIPNFTSYSIEGQYDLSQKMVDIKAKWDTDEFAIKSQLANFSSKKSENSASLKIPRVGPVEITFAHDFTNPLDKSISLTGTVNGQPFHYKEHWTRNAQFTTFDYQADIQSNFIGTIKIEASYDMTDINNAKGSLAYTRDGKNNINADWHRTRTDDKLENILTVKSQSPIVPNIKAYAIGDFKNGIDLQAGIEWRNKKMEAKFTVGAKKAVASLKTPFPIIGSISAEATYKISPKKKNIKFHYERKDKKIDLSINLQTPSRKDGSLAVKLSSPFEFAKSLTLDADWKAGDFKAHYQRNDKTVDFAGKASVKQGNSSFDVDFVLPSGKKVALNLAYDLPDFIRAKSKQSKEILSLGLKIAGKEVSMKLIGYRSPEKVFLDLSGSSTLDRLRDFHVTLDSELNLEKREGQLTIKINDFFYDMKNLFKRLNDGYYARTQIHSSLTKLPGLTLGYGRDGTSRFITLGYGDEREVTITVNGKDMFKKGFYGKIDIPRRGVVGIDYHINYGFKGNDKLQVEGEIILKDGQTVNLNVNYHSDGVKTRLTTPWTGLIRARRSISNNEMDAEFGINDHFLRLQSGNTGIGMKKGVSLSGVIMGKKVGIEAFADVNTIFDTEMKFVVYTPFTKLEKAGAELQIRKVENKFVITSDINMIGNVHTHFVYDPKGEIKGKINVGLMSQEPLRTLAVHMQMFEHSKLIHINWNNGETTLLNFHMENTGNSLLITGKLKDCSIHISHEVSSQANKFTATITSKEKVSSKVDFIYDNDHIALDMMIVPRITFEMNVNFNNLDGIVALRLPGREHLFTIKSSYADGVTTYVGKIKSPKLPSKKIDFVGAISTQDSMKISIQAQTPSVIHRIQIEADDKPVYLLIDIASPLLQSGAAKAEVKIKGKSMLKMKGKFTLEDANQGYSGKFTTDMESPEEKTIDIEFRSPIEQLKKVKIGLGFKQTEKQEFYMYAEPFNFKTDLFLGKENGAYVAGLNVVPGPLSLKPVVASAIIPFDFFNPQFVLTVDGERRELDVIYDVSQPRKQFGFAVKTNTSVKETILVIRNKAPYEFGIKGKYHIMFDSSFDFLTPVFIPQVLY